MTYFSTESHRELRNQLVVLVIRGIYGVVVALTLYILFSINTGTVFILRNIIGDYYPYFVWLYLFIFYPLSIAIVKMITDVKSKYNLYLRGISVYFASSVITYIIISST